MSLKNSVTSPGIDPGTVRLVAQRPTHYTTPVPINFMLNAEKLPRFSMMSDLEKLYSQVAPLMPTKIV